MLSAKESIFQSIEAVPQRRPQTGSGGCSGRWLEKASQEEDRSLSGKLDPEGTEESWEAPSWGVTGSDMGIQKTSLEGGS